MTAAARQRVPSDAAVLHVFEREHERRPYGAKHRAAKALRVSHVHVANVLARAAPADDPLRYVPCPGEVELQDRRRQESEARLLAALLAPEPVTKVEDRAMTTRTLPVRVETFQPIALQPANVSAAQERALAELSRLLYASYAREAARVAWLTRLLLPAAVGCLLVAVKLPILGLALLAAFGVTIKIGIGR